MVHKDMSSAKAIALTFGVLIVSVVLGLVIGAVTFDWWFELMFGGPNGTIVTALLVLPVAFLIPFFGALIAQICILFLIGRSKFKKEN